jgi:hypothetical protein
LNSGKSSLKHLNTADQAAYLASKRKASFDTCLVEVVVFGVLKQTSRDGSGLSSTCKDNPHY